MVTKDDVILSPCLRKDCAGPEVQERRDRRTVLTQADPPLVSIHCVGGGVNVGKSVRVWFVELVTFVEKKKEYRTMARAFYNVIVKCNIKKRRIWMEWNVCSGKP